MHCSNRSNYFLNICINFLQVCILYSTKCFISKHNWIIFISFISVTKKSRKELLCRLSLHTVLRLGQRRYIKYSRAVHFINFNVATMLYRAPAPTHPHEKLSSFSVFDLQHVFCLEVTTTLILPSFLEFYLRELLAH